MRLLTFEWKEELQRVTVTEEEIMKAFLLICKTVSISLKSYIYFIFPDLNKIKAVII